MLPYHLTNSFHSNFLYNPDLREGVLVDFGLAEVSFFLFHTFVSLGFFLWDNYCH